MVRLLRHRSLTSLVPDSSNLRRAFSEANLNSNAATSVNTSQTFIGVNQTNFTVGEKIVVSWNIKGNTSDKDWIGLFYEDETSPENAIDTRKRGIGRSKQGSLLWVISKDFQLKSAINYCHLKYFYGPTGAVLATSQQFSIDVPLSLLPKRMPSLGNIGADSLLVVSISGVSAKDLKKGFFGKPNPYVRMCIVPRFRGLAVIQKYHGQQAKTIAQNNTVNPCWNNELFVFHATPADFLEVEIRNKSGKGFSKFLGKISFPLCTIMDSCGYNKFRTVTQSLVGRNPGEKAQGSFQFTIFIRKSTVPKGDQEIGEEARSSPKQHRILKTANSAPLDDMALPSGQPIAASGSRRPLSYHPATSYQMHCSTEPRSRNYTTNYFASAAFRGQGHPGEASDFTPRRNRMSNSFCQERLSVLSSEEESDSQDEAEPVSFEREAGPAVIDRQVSSHPLSQQNGHPAEGSESQIASTGGSGIVGQATGATRDTERDSESEANSDRENESADAGARTTTSLLRFTDPGPSFEEFVEQQNQSSEGQSQSSADEAEQDSSIGNSEDASVGMADESSEQRDELFRVEGGTAAAGEEGDEASVSQDEESSDTSTSADDGGDSAERGYIEVEPGYADGQSDTASQCSDVEEDEMYVEDGMASDMAEGAVLGEGDLLAECFDMLSAVGYSDIRSGDAARSDIVESALTRDKGKKENPIHENRERGLEYINRDGPNDVPAAKFDSLVQSEPVQRRAKVTNEEPLALERDFNKDEANGNIGNVLSVLNDLELHAESLLSKPGQSSTASLESVSVTKESQDGVVKNAVKTDALPGGGENEIPFPEMHDESTPPPLPLKDRYEPRSDRLNQEVEDDRKYRNRSYYKAVSKASTDKESESQKLSKLNTVLNSLWSPITQDRDNDSGELPAKEEMNGSLQGRKTDSQHGELPQPGKQDKVASNVISSPFVDMPVLLSGKAPEDVSTGFSSGTNTPSIVVDTSSDKSASAAFSSRHRILRGDESDSPLVSPSSSVAPSNERHRISNRSDVDDSSNSSYNGSKLKYSISDPLAKTKTGVKIPLNKRISDQMLRSLKAAGCAVEFDSPIFRGDLVESSVDEDDSTLNTGPKSAVKRKPLVPTSSSVVFDAAKLEDASVKSLRETAILSSSEDLTSGGNSKNKPIGRSDQPIIFNEITLPSASKPLASGAQNDKDKRNAAIERPAPVAADLPFARKEKKPPLPPRTSSFENAMLLDGRAQDTAATEPVKDPWQNVTVRKEKRSKTFESGSSTTEMHDSNTSKIAGNLSQVAKLEPIQGVASPATSASTSCPGSASSTQLEENKGKSFMQNTSRDPTGATRPRATAIQRSTPESTFESPSGLPNSKKNRPLRPEIARAAEIEHKSRLRSPSELAQPLTRERLRSPSEPPVTQAGDSSRPPAIPPRSNRSNKVAREKQTASKDATNVSVRITTSSPASSRPSSVSSSTSSTPSSSRAELPKRPGNDAARSRVEHNAAVSRSSRESESAQATTRSPAILHSDNHGRRGDHVNSGKQGSQPAVTDETGDYLPSHWERAVDSHGRIYYIDHLHRTTTWKRPRKDTQTATEGGTTTTAQLQQQHLQQYDRRYQSLRRTIRGQRRAGESNRPTILPQDNRQAENEPNRDRPRHLNRRQTAETSVAAAAAAAAVAKPKPESTPDASATDGPAAKSQTPSSARTPTKGSFEDTPGCKFIRRRDFFQFVNNHGMASQFLHRSVTLKQMLNRIRADPSKFERYQHSRDLVTLLNFFSNPVEELPPGWEKKTDQSAHTYFIDHTTRSTTFIDPRLPSDEQSPVGARTRTNAPTAAATPEGGSSSRSRFAGNAQQATPTSRSQGANPSSSRQPEITVPKKVSYNERVVAFLRQQGIEDVFKTKDCNLPSKNALRRKIMVIQRDGVRALDKLSNDIELVILLSMFEDEIESFVLPSMHKEQEHPATPETKETRVQLPKETPKEHQRPPVSRKQAPHRRDFEAKLRSFHRSLVQSGYGQGPGKIRMKIRRDHVVSDAFEQLMKQPPRALQRDRLYIKFLGEEGLDYGGPAREFFFLISRQCFDPYYGLFEYSASDTYTLQVSPVAARFVSNSHAWLRFCGRIIALSLVHQHLLDVFFTRTIYKALLRQSYDLSDLESFDPEFHKSLSWILENDITDVLDMFFTTDEKVFDQVTERPLKPGGESIPVTEENKREYVDLMIKWRMERGVGEQMKQLVDGFNEVLSSNVISIFDARELELVIAGTADIDVKDWRVNTDYRSGYHDKHPVIQWFWKAVDSVNNEQRLRLLQFVTGTSSIPFEGFSALRGSTGPRKFTIDCWGDPTMLPRAHTCFNRLDLPPYRNFEELHEKLLYAVEETSSFGIE